MTVAVFVGFGYLLWSDLTINLNDKLYSFTVRDKLMSEEQCSNTTIDFGTYNQSLNFIIGIEPFLPPEEKELFDPLDNDYVQFKIVHRNTTEDARKEGGDRPEVLNTNPDWDFERCSDKAFHDLVVPTLRFFYSKPLCLKYPDRVAFNGNAYLKDNGNKFINIWACDPKKRSTCKSRTEIGKFMSKSTFYIHS